MTTKTPTAFADLSRHTRRADTSVYNDPLLQDLCLDLFDSEFDTEAIPRQSLKRERTPQAKEQPNKRMKIHSKDGDEDGQRMRINDQDSKNETTAKKPIVSGSIEIFSSADYHQLPSSPTKLRRQHLSFSTPYWTKKRLSNPMALSSPDSQKSPRSTSSEHLCYHLVIQQHLPMRLWMLHVPESDTKPRTRCASWLSIDSKVRWHVFGRSLTRLRMRRNRCCHCTFHSPRILRRSKDFPASRVS